MDLLKGGYVNEIKLLVLIVFNLLEVKGIFLKFNVEEVKFVDVDEFRGVWVRELFDKKEFKI